MVVLVPGFLEFTRTLDSVLGELSKKGKLMRGISPQALRSGLMGAVEGMLRDRLLARPPRLAASYSEAHVRRVFQIFVNACLKS